jgi:alginate O-acetyltransferase complex protein AlgI
MVFSSTVFLFLFLPVVLGVYFLIPGIALRNLFLLVASLFFYAWGELQFTLIMVGSIALNYCFGLVIEKYHGQRLAKLVLIGAIALNLGVLVYFKYANFLAENLNPLLGNFNVSPIALGKIHLPAGISFFTFHAVSYLVDIQRRTCQAQKSPVKLAVYFDFFPQLIAGPIIRYHDIEAQLSQRTVTLEKFVSGIQRFVIGLGKKMLIANTLGAPADQIFAIPNDQLTPGLAWLGVISYTLQIYFDFSGYSDMAIGLGRMFGFEFLENFNYPYISRSIREFWRRWHISLSNWFRDYLYIPLGGNRGTPFQEYRNLVIVFFLCGLWHGASWNFIIWGLFHGLFLVLERQSFMRWLDLAWAPIRHAYALSIVIIGWVFFRAVTLEQAIAFLQAMVGIAGGNGIEYHPGLYLHTEQILTLMVGCVASVPVLVAVQTWIQKRLDKAEGSSAIALDSSFRLLGLGGLSAIFLVSAMKMASSTYNPFIYFRF